MIIRWTSFILLLYLFWNHDRFSISTLDENLVSLEVIKHISTFALPYFLIIVILCLIINILYSVRIWFLINIISYIISAIIIIIVTILLIKISMYTESTDFVVFRINHPLSGEDKINYFIKYLQEHAIIYSSSITNPDERIYFESTLYSYGTKIKLEDIMKMNVEQIENYCLTLILKVATDAYWMHDKTTYYFFVAMLIVYLVYFVG